MTIGESRGTKSMLLAACAVLAMAPAAAYAQRVSYSIPAQDLGTALTQLARQSNREIVFSADLTRGKRAPRLSGKVTFEEALGRLLAGSGLLYRLSANGSFIIEVADQEGNGGAGASDDERGKAEILVVGNRSQNVDIRRSRDDAQPYVIFNRTDLEQSGATTVEDFFKSRLPMNASSSTIDQDPTNPAGIQGNINLRGLGSGQTLILVDGRRLASAATQNAGFYQTNIGGIPLAAIDRIEILPSTASAIYGGGATGGAINIIRKRNYSGLDIQLGYGNSFKGDVGEYEASAVGGLSLFHGRTNIGFSLSYSGGDPLYATDRPFGLRARQLLLTNQPAAIKSATVTPTSATPNVCAAQILTPTIGLCRNLPLTLDSGQVLSAPFTFIPDGYRGVGSDGGTAILGNAGAYSLSPVEDGQYLLRAPTRYAASLDIRQEISSWLTAYATGSRETTISKVSLGNTSAVLLFAAADADNPFQQAVRVSVPVPGLARPGRTRIDVTRAAAGFIVKLPDSWGASLERTWNQTRYSFESTVGNLLSPAGLTALRAVAFQDPRLAPIDITPYKLDAPNLFGGPFTNILQATSLRVSGPLLRLPAGSIKVTGLMEYRDERTDVGYQRYTATGYPLAAVTQYPRQFQKVNSYYLEAVVPLFSPQQNIPFLHNADVQASVRHDQYETRSPSVQPTATSMQGPFQTPTYFTNEVSSTDFLVALRYSPSRDIMFRASYGTGFLPPGLTQIIPTSRVASLTSSVDPRRGGTVIPTPYTFINGGNPNLKPEVSRSLSVGIVATPRFMQNLRISADYTRIEKSDEIFAVPEQYIINNETLFPGRIVRGANLPGDQPGWAGPITSIDETNVNAATTRVSAVDFQFDYQWKLAPLGAFSLSGIATQFRTFKRLVAVGTPVYDSVGFLDGPLRWKASGSLTWTSGPVSVQWNTQYYDSYSILNSNPAVFTNAASLARQGTDRIPSQMYHDLGITYRFANRSGMMRGLVLTAGVWNIFNKMPPITVAAATDTVGLGTYSPYGDPRLRRFRLGIRKSF